MYYTYILRCCDNTLYTGIALDIEKRMNEHFLQNEKCANIKHLTKKQKEEIISLKSLDVLKDKLPIENYNYSDMKLNSVN